MGRLDRLTLAKLACAYSGVTWGLFWFPLRWLDEAGVEGPWIGTVFFGVQLLIVLPFALWRFEKQRSDGLSLVFTGIFAGGALAFYALSIIYTDVIRAILLFYLTPVWSTILARIILKEHITVLRGMAIVMAFAGLAIVLGGETAIPWPSNAGDWLGLASGALWACAAVRLRLDDRNEAFEITFGFFLWSTLFCLIGAILPTAAQADMPSWALLAPELAWLFPALAIIAVPGAIAAMWGAKHVDPGLVGILFMTEIIVGTITVAMWAGEPFGWREFLGIVLIMGAGLIESVWDLWQQRNNPKAGQVS